MTTRRGLRSGTNAGWRSVIVIDPAFASRWPRPDFLQVAWAGPFLHAGPHGRSRHLTGVQAHR